MSSVRIRLPLPGPLVKRLRHRPFTAVTWVRFPYGSPCQKSSALRAGFFLRLRAQKAVSQPLFPGSPQSYSHSPQTYPQGLNRFVPVSGRYDEWHPPFVGAMKIARNVAVFGRWGEWYHVLHFTIQPGTCETVGLRAIFIAPTKGGFHSSGCSLKSGVTGDFHRPYERVRSIGEKIRWGMGNGCFLTQFGVFSHAYTFSVR